MQEDRKFSGNCDGRAPLRVLSSMFRKLRSPVSDVAITSKWSQDVSRLYKQLPEVSVSFL